MAGNRFRQKGYTLIELMTILIILGIITAIAMPYLVKARYQAQWSTCQFNLRGIGIALKIYAADNTLYPEDISAIYTGNPPYLSPKPVCPSNLSNYGYTVAPDRKSFSIYCQGIHYLGISGVKEGFPQYNSFSGLDATGK
jgi:prepilin-type N-terminal cleavage/methylation domain-containing protein